MTSSPNLDQISPEQLRALAAQLLSRVDTMGSALKTATLLALMEN
jgi:hypothetical protein